MFAFGLNNWGQLGLGYGGTSEFEPVEVQALCDIAEIAGGVDFSIALDNHGRVFTFGAAQPVMQMMDLPHYSSVWCQTTARLPSRATRGIWTWDVRDGPQVINLPAADSKSLN